MADPTRSVPRMNLPPGAILHTGTPMPSVIDGREINIVKRGEAVAHVRQLEDTVEQQQKLIASLERSHQTCEDRLAMVDEDRRKWRADAETYRVALVELSSDMRNINLLTQRASDTHTKVLAVIGRDPPEETPPPRAGGGFSTPGVSTNAVSEAIRRMEETVKGTPSDPPPLFLSEEHSSRDDAGEHRVETGQEPPR
jgi:hypothetical protein